MLKFCFSCRQDVRGSHARLQRLQGLLLLNGAALLPYRGELLTSAQLPLLPKMLRHMSQLTMRFLSLLKSHWQILTPSPTKPVGDEKRARIVLNYFNEFVPSRNQHSE